MRNNNVGVNHIRFSRLKKSLFELARKAIDIFDSESIHGGGDVADGLLGSGPQRDTTSVWRTLVETDEYNLVLKGIGETKKEKIVPERSFYETILSWFIYDVIDGITNNDPRPTDRMQKHIILELMNVLLEDIIREDCMFFVKGPLFKFESDCNIIKMNGFSIRLAKFSEQSLFEKRYPRGMGVGKERRIKWMLDLECTESSVEYDAKLANQFNTLAGNIITSLRLLSGGSVGIEYLELANIPFSKEMKIGQSVNYWEVQTGTSRSIRPTKEITKFNSSDLKSLKFLVKSITDLDYSKADFVWRAIRRFGYSLESRLLDDKIIDLVIGLESLLGGSKTVSALRAATLVSYEPGYDASMEDFLNKCWKARDALVHGRSVTKAEEECGYGLEDLSKKLTDIARRGILIAIAMNPKDKKEFWESIDLASNSDTSKKAILASIPNWFSKTIGLE